MNKCPGCGRVFTPEEAFRLVQSARGSKMTPAKVKSFRKNLGLDKEKNDVPENSERSE